MILRALVHIIWALTIAAARFVWLHIGRPRQAAAYWRKRQA